MKFSDGNDNVDNDDGNCRGRCSRRIEYREHVKNILDTQYKAMDTCYFIHFYFLLCLIPAFALHSLALPQFEIDRREKALDRKYYQQWNKI